MKKTIITWTLLIFLLSWCSFINEKQIEESNPIDIDTFLEKEIKKPEISEEELEGEKVEEEIKELIDILFETSD